MIDFNLEELIISSILTLIILILIVLIGDLRQYKWYRMTILDLSDLTNNIRIQEYALNYIYSDDIIITFGDEKE